jgi:hypothetical protein
MRKLSRRSFDQTPLGVPSGTVAVDGAPGAATIEGSSRRVFLQSSAGAVTGAAIILAAPKVASLARDGSGSSLPAEPKPLLTKPSGPAPREPVTAYVRDAERGEVTVMSGTRETTYIDPVLVKRLQAAAR